MCKLCENKLPYARIDNGWLYIESNIDPGCRAVFAVGYCPWCGKEITDSRMMPKITPKEWKYQMQEQESENEL